MRGPCTPLKQPNTGFAIFPLSALEGRLKKIDLPLNSRLSAIIPVDCPPDHRLVFALAGPVECRRSVKAVALAVMPGMGRHGRSKSIVPYQKRISSCRQQTSISWSISGSTVTPPSPTFAAKRRSSTTPLRASPIALSGVLMEAPPSKPKDTTPTAS